MQGVPNKRMQLSAAVISVILALEYRAAATDAQDVSPTRPRYQLYCCIRRIVIDIMGV